MWILSRYSSVTFSIGADPAAITQAAVDALGGMARFVSKGDDVIVKTIISAENSLVKAMEKAPVKPDQRFQLLGFDILIDNHGDVPGRRRERCPGSPPDRRR